MTPASIVIDPIYAVGPMGAFVDDAIIYRKLALCAHKSCAVTIAFHTGYDVFTHTPSRAAVLVAIVYLDITQWTSEPVYTTASVSHVWTRDASGTSLTSVTIHHLTGIELCLTIWTRIIWKTRTIIFKILRR